MRPETPRFLPILALTLLSGCISLAQSAPRSAPTRPGTAAAKPERAALAEESPSPPKPKPAPARRAPKIELVNLETAAARLGLKLSADATGRKLTLTGRGRKAELEVDSREVEIDGLRVFLGTSIRAGRGEFYVSETDYVGCLLPILQPALMTRPPAVKVVAIDAGHGGTDNGMENQALKLKEKVLTLDVAQRLRRLLEARGYRVVLTRKDDAALHPEKIKDFELRADVANRAGADLFVSIHFNSLFPDTKTGGTEIYTFTRAGQRSDRSWGFGQDDDAETTPSPVNRFDQGSALLAQSVHRAVIDELKTLDRGHKTMHSAVLRGLKCPAVLVESVFLSNEREARLAGTPAYRQQIAAALAAGIENYAQTVEGLNRRR